MGFDIGRSGLFLAGIFGLLLSPGLGLGPGFAEPLGQEGGGFVVDWSQLDQSLSLTDPNRAFPFVETDSPSFEAPPVSEECAQFLRLNLQLNPHRVEESCRLESLDTDQLEDVRRALRQRRRGCAELTRYRMQDLDLERFQRQSNPLHGSGGGPSVDWGIRLRVTGSFPFVGRNAERARLEFETPAGNARWTFHRTTRPPSTIPSTRERHPWVQDGRDAEGRIKDHLRDLDLNSAFEDMDPQSLGQIGLYRGVRKLYGEARGNSTWDQRRAGEFYRDQADCERFFDTKIAYLNALLGARR